MVSMVGGVLNMVVWQVVLGGVLVTWFLVTVFTWQCGTFEGPCLPLSGHVFLGSKCIWRCPFGFSAFYVKKIK
jgi:hypothetical protein